MLLQVTPAAREIETLIARFEKPVDPELGETDEEFIKLRRCLSGLSPLLDEMVAPGCFESLNALFRGSEGWANVLLAGEAMATLHSRKPEEYPRGLARLKELQEKGGPLWCDVATEFEARHYARVRQHTKACELLAKVKHPTEWSGRAKAIMEDHAMRLHSQPTE